MYLNANIPLIECYVRGNFLRDQKDSHDQYFKCVVFAVSSIPKQVPLFSFVMEDGGIWWRSPISAFCKKPGTKELPLNELVLWDSFSYNMSITTFYHFEQRQDVGLPVGTIDRASSEDVGSTPKMRLELGKAHTQGQLRFALHWWFTCMAPRDPPPGAAVTRAEPRPRRPYLGSG